MRDLLNNRLHYHVTTDAPEGMQATTAASLEQLAEALPHGSGLDASWHVAIRPRGRGFTLTTEYHVMNNGGYYDGWRAVRITLNRSRVDGRLSLGTVRVNESGSGWGLGDMLADMLADVCRAVNPS